MGREMTKCTVRRAKGTKELVHANTGSEEHKFTALQMRSDDENTIRLFQLLQSVLQRLASQDLERLEIFGTSGLDHILWHGHSLLAFKTIFGQPVSEELLVETVLTLTNLIGRLGPESRAVRSQHLVHKNNFVRLFIQAKLEFCVCDDDTFLFGIISCSLVYLERKLLDALCVFLAHNRCGLLSGDVLIMLAQLGLCAGGVYWFRELLRLFQSFRHLLSVHLTGFLV